jgi:hypothetical protein
LASLPKREEEKRKGAEAKRLARLDVEQKEKEANRMRIFCQDEEKREEEKRKDAEAKRLARLDEERREEEGCRSKKACKAKTTANCQGEEENGVQTWLI